MLALDDPGGLTTPESVVLTGTTAFLANGCHQRAQG